MGPLSRFRTWLAARQAPSIVPPPVAPPAKRPRCSPNDYNVDPDDGTVRQGSLVPGVGVLIPPVDEPDPSAWCRVMLPDDGSGGDRFMTEEEIDTVGVHMDALFFAPNLSLETALDRSNALADVCARLMEAGAEPHEVEIVALMADLEAQRAPYHIPRSRSKLP